ncbi:MAG: DUF2779 domain-containing protein [Spirochaetia bacterium]
MTPTHAPALLSKTRYIQGLQCAKLLWHVYNARQLVPPVDEGTRAIFDQGHEVGLLAQKLFPGGIAVEGDIPFDQVVTRSKELLQRRVPLFEAGFRHGRLIARADVLKPAGDDGWNLVEVKSTASVKEPHGDDLAVQRRCYEGAGLRIRRCELLHIDTRYVRQGPVDPQRLFARVDVTRAVEKRTTGIERRIDEMLRVIDGAHSPEVPIGPQCNSPYPCPLVPLCWKSVLETSNSVLSVPRLGARAWQLYRQGVETTGSIPADVRLSRSQRIQVNAERTGQPCIKVRAVRKFLAALRFPLHYLDFETFQTAIPMLDGTRPYQQVPFQFSLHIAERAGGPLQHHSWIWDGHGDPRGILLDELQRLIGPRGSIVAYGAAFEKTRLKECAEAHPEHGGWVHGVLGRVVDLLAPFRSYAVYFPAQAGSASMKRVLPALTGRSYRDLAIHEGGQASLEFKRITFGGAPEEERLRVRRQLAGYCGLDTEGMADIVRALGVLADRG